MKKKFVALFMVMAMLFSTVSVNASALSDGWMGGSDWPEYVPIEVMLMQYEGYEVLEDADFDDYWDILIDVMLYLDHAFMTDLAGVIKALDFERDLEVDAWLEKFSDEFEELQRITAGLVFHNEWSKIMQGKMLEAEVDLYGLTYVMDLQDRAVTRVIEIVAETAKIFANEDSTARDLVVAVNDLQAGLEKAYSEWFTAYVLDMQLYLIWYHREAKFDNFPDSEVVGFTILEMYSEEWRIIHNQLVNVLWCAWGNIFRNANGEDWCDCFHEFMSYSGIAAQREYLETHSILFEYLVENVEMSDGLAELLDVLIMLHDYSFMLLDYLETQIDLLVYGFDFDDILYIFRDMFDEMHDRFGEIEDAEWYWYEFEDRLIDTLQTYADMYAEEIAAD